MKPSAGATSELLDLFSDADDEALIACDSEGLVSGASAAAERLLGVRVGVGTRLDATGIDYRLVRLVADPPSGDGPKLIDIKGRQLAVRVRSWQGGLVLHARDESRLRQLQRTRADFVSNVSHELRTPLTAIRLLAETLAGGAVDDASAAHGFVDRILVEAGQMEQLVEELLMLSNLETGEIQVRPGRVDPEELLVEARRLQPLVDEAGLTLTATLAAATPPIRGDRAQLGQVVRNLVHNAIKFTPRGGRIELTARAQGEGVEIVCADTGVGISRADQERIFERFWKGDTARDRRDGHGAGLGLAIVRHAVEAHSGSVRVESEPGHGTRFILLLPALSSL